MLSPSQLPNAARSTGSSGSHAGPQSCLHTQLSLQAGHCPGGPEVDIHPAPRAQQVLPHLYLAQDTDRWLLCEQGGQAEGGEYILARFAESIQAKLTEQALLVVCLKYLV